MAGGLAIDRAALRSADPRDIRRLVAAAALSAAGTDRPPPGVAVQTLAERLRGKEPLVSSLAGARIEADARQVRFLREAGETARGGLAPIHLAPGQPGVWDGRFEITADRPAVVGPLRGQSGRLTAPQRRALAALPAGARPALPWIDGGCPLLAPMPGIDCLPLAHDRLLAACGLIDREPD